VRGLITTLDEAKSLGAMALFGEKYGDVVRMVEVGDGNWSRELCGGTHVRSTAEIGAFVIASETSSAANVRRIEAYTGPVAVHELREGRRILHDAALALRTAPDNVAEVAEAHEQERRKLLKGVQAAPAVDDKLSDVVELDGVRAAFELREGAPAKALPDIADRMKNQLGDPGVVVLGAGAEGKASLLVAATPGAIERGVKAGDIVKVAAKVVGGGGGGRDNMAQAGGREPDKLADALEAARAEIERVLAG
jgi:alanyl-tRNA synthetase